MKQSLCNLTSFDKENLMSKDENKFVPTKKILN